MSYAGIDFDTHAVHLVLRPEDGRPATYTRYALAGVEAWQRARAVRDAMPSRGWWRDEGVVAVGLEEPFGYGGSGAKLVRVQGAILACLPPELIVHLIPPGVWRTLVGLPGNASKAEVARYVAHTNWPQDACDAFCLALAAEALLG